MRDFEGKIAVVTGAASGIGRALAQRFAEEGMKVVLADVEQIALDAAVTELRHAEHDVIGVVTDVSNKSAVEALAQKTLDTYGKVHVVCNNAGVTIDMGTVLWEATDHDWDWVLGVNLWGVINGVRTFVPIMLAQDEPGHIVNTSSIAGLAYNSGGVYGVGKHAVVGLTESLYLQLKRREAKISCSVLCPSGVITNIMSAERNRPAELADADRQVAEDARAFHEMMTKGIATIGDPPEHVANLVVAAIRDDRFYILTSKKAQQPIRQRMESILAQRNPDPKTLMG